MKFRFLAILLLTTVQLIATGQIKTSEIKVLDSPATDGNTVIDDNLMVYGNISLKPGYHGMAFVESLSNANSHQFDLTQVFPNIDFTTASDVSVFFKVDVLRSGGESGTFLAIFRKRDTGWATNYVATNDNHLQAKTRAWNDVGHSASGNTVSIFWHNSGATGTVTGVLEVWKR